MRELVFYGSGGHIYSSPARFVQEAGGRLLLHELAYSFFWDESGAETTLTHPAVRASPPPEVEARFRAALAKRGAGLRLPRARTAPPPVALPPPPPLASPAPSDDDGF